MKNLLPAFLLLSLICGCSAETKTYSSGLSKHPVFLKLKPDGSYLIEQHFKYTILDTGRWWELEESLLALLPDDPAKQAHFARVGSDAAPRGYLLYPDLRSTLGSSPQLQHMPASSEEASEEQEAEEQARLGKLRELMARLDPGPLSKEEYRSLTDHPYSRDPFRDDDLAAKAYFNGFRSGFALRTREPGQLYHQFKVSGSLIDAAKDAGFSAGLMGYTSQLSDEERQEIEQWKQKYKDVSSWPYRANIQNEIEIKMKSSLKQLEKDIADEAANNSVQSIYER